MRKTSAALSQVIFFCARAVADIDHGLILTMQAASKQGNEQYRFHE